MLATVTWCFAGLCGIALLGVLLHELTRRRDPSVPAVWNSPSFGSDLVYGVIGNLAFALAFGIALPWTSGDASAISLAIWTGALLLLHDAYFYWCHRLLHVPLLFRHVHAVHHRSRVPTPLSAMAMHPIEATLEALFVPIAALVLHPPTAAFYAFFVAMIALNTLGHLGIRGLPLLNGRPGALRLVSQSDTHLQHHVTPDRDFGAYLTWWDRMFGTSTRPPV